MQIDNLEEVINTYTEEYQTDIKFDDFTLKEFELKVPSLKGKWSTRKAIHKARLIELENKYESLLDKGTEKIYESSQNSPNPISNKPAARNIVKKSDSAKEIAHNIKCCKVLIEYFESIEKHISSVGFDIKNIVETMKLEAM